MTFQRSGSQCELDVSVRRSFWRNASKSALDIRLPDVALFAKDLEVLDNGLAAQAPWNNMIHV
jgi:hypothetical protein